MTTRVPHTSVLLEELVAGLALKGGDIAIDCTTGAGGHTERMLAEVIKGGASGKVIGLDRDDTALGLAKKRLAAAVDKGQVELVKSDFSGLANVVKARGLEGKVAGICADIGVSSMQLDTPERGFSFQSDGPLDMRMDQSKGRTAADLLAEESEAELIRIFREYGEEPKARQIARRIVKDRDTQPLTTTSQLAELVKDAAAYRGPSRKHPATRVFQALRIAVNDELGELEKMLEAAFAALKPGGRLAIIAFHSLEDRIVKDFCVELTGRRERARIARDLPLTEAQVQSMHTARAEIIKPFPMTASDEEIERNPRSRSAKLRVLEKK